MKCKNCRTKEAVKYSEYSNGLFCSKKCSKSFSTKFKRDEINDKLSNYWEKRPKSKKYCKYCNIEINEVRHKNISGCESCLKWKNYKTLFIKLGSYNSEKTFEENNEIALKILYDLYFNKKLSKINIKNQYNLRENTIYNYFKKNNISLRSSTDAMLSYVLSDRYTLIESNNQYKQGWHTTWDNKQVYYRSSYELRFAEELDIENIPYEMEFKRFLYWNTQNKKWQVAIPDFYLPLENKIVEIKSNYSLNKLEMIDKSNEYKKQGYNFELKILD